MYKNVLQNINNIEIWPIISIVIFFVFFLCLLWWVFKVDKDFIARMASLPMDDNNDKTDTLTQND